MKFRSNFLSSQSSKTASNVPSFEALLEAYEGDVTPEDRARYDYHVRDLNKLTFPLTLYRHIFVNSLNDIQLEGIGRYWSNDETLAFSHNANEENGDIEVMLRAVVTPAEIDWMDTAYARIVFGEDEAEVSIAPGTPLNVTGIKVNGEWQTPPKGVQTA